MSFKSRYGPWALVAGGSDGIGAEFARQLGRRGLNLVLVARHADPLRELERALVSEFAIEVRTVPLDLSKREQIDLLVKETSDLEVGLLVCNAAVSIIAPFLGQELSGHEGMLDLNCRMPLVLGHAFGGRMEMRGRGGIIFLSSMAAFHGTPLAAHYGATKAYLQILAEGLWQELRPHGVDVIAVCPATVDTPTFLREQPVKSCRTFPPTLESRRVVASALKALGRKPVVVPGAWSKLAALVSERLLPRTVTIELTARGTAAMYPARSGGGTRPERKKRR